VKCGRLVDAAPDGLLDGGSGRVPLQRFRTEQATLLGGTAQGGFDLSGVRVVAGGALSYDCAGFQKQVGEDGREQQLGLGSLDPVLLPICSRICAPGVLRVLTRLEQKRLR
jgi:hypothetical protein